MNYKKALFITAFTMAVSLITPFSVANANFEASTNTKIQTALSSCRIKYHVPAMELSLCVG